MEGARRLRPLRLLVAASLLFLFAAACSRASSFELTPTIEPPTPVATRSAPPAAPTSGLPSPTPYPPMSLRPADPTQALTEGGGYLLDVVTGELWYLGPRAGSWSPDSRFLASTMCCIGNGYVEIFDLQTRQSVRVETGDVTFHGWSPDGRVIAYSSWDPAGERAHLFVMDRSGANARRLGEVERLWRVRWISDSEVGVISGRDDQPQRYFVFDLRDGGRTELQRTNPVSDRDPRIVFGSPSPNGQLVVFHEGQSFVDGQTYLWRRATGEVRKLHDMRLSVSWAPDSRRLITSHSAYPLPSPVFAVIDAATGQRTEMPEFGLWTEWLPDGERVVHAGFRCANGGVAGPLDVFVANADGTGARNLTNNPEHHKYEVLPSPSAAMVAFVLRQVGGELHWEVHVVDVDSGQVLHRLFSRMDLHVHAGAWSPDGRYLRIHGPGGHGICT